MYENEGQPALVSLLAPPSREMTMGCYATDLDSKADDHKLLGKAFLSRIFLESMGGGDGPDWRALFRISFGSDIFVGRRSSRGWSVPLSARVRGTRRRTSAHSP